jgi:hypothetical protein
LFGSLTISGLKLLAISFMIGSSCQYISTSRDGPVHIPEFLRGFEYFICISARRDDSKSASQAFSILNLSGFVGIGTK